MAGNECLIFETKKSDDILYMLASGKGFQLSISIITPRYNYPFVYYRFLASSPIIIPRQTCSFLLPTLHGC